MKIHHIGIVVDDIEKSTTIYETLGYEKTSNIVEDLIQNNKLLFLKQSNSDVVIELIQPMSEKSTVYNKGNAGIHHFCYQVENLEEFISDFKEKRIGKIFTNKIKAPAFANREVIFAYLKNGTIIEVIQEDDTME
ncbi:VOC family protein [Clostridium sp. CTA-7]